MSAPRLITCRDCGGTISRNADRCPHCGAETLIARVAHIPKVLTSIILLAGVGWIVWTWDRHTATPEAAQPALTAAQCRADPACWADRHQWAAGIACRQRVEAQARYQARWPAGRATFAYTEPSRRTPGAIVYLGDGAELQNGFGAWRPHTYACTYSPDSRSVLNLEVIPGRI